MFVRKGRKGKIQCSLTFMKHSIAFYIKFVKVYLIKSVNIILIRPLFSMIDIPVSPIPL